MTVEERIANVKERAAALEPYTRQGPDYLRSVAGYVRDALQFADEVPGRYERGARVGEAEYWIGRAERAKMQVMDRRARMARGVEVLPSNRDLGLVRLRFAMDGYASLKLAGEPEGSDALQRQVEEALTAARIVVEAERARV